MIFTELTLKNFFRYGNNEQTFQLDRNGIWNITGLNGYGKSTIIEAIVWCLFGKTRQEKVEDVVNRKTKKDCKVSVSFTDEKNTYKVIRYRQHTLHKNNVLIFINDEDKTPHTASEANQMIQEILGFNYITFVNSSIFSSTLYKKFLDADNKDRLIVMENLLDLKQITAFYAKTKDLIKETKDSYEEVNLDFTSKYSDLNSLKNSLLQYKENAKEKLVSLKLEKKRLEEEKESLISEKEKLLNIDIEKEKKILTDKEYIDSLKKEYDEKRKSLKPEEKPSQNNSENLKLRVASDFIKLPELHKSAYYCCSEIGLVLAVDKTNVHPKNGDLLSVKRPKSLENSDYDKKSGAVILEI